MALPFGLLLSALSFVSTVHGIAFPGPHPTQFADRFGDGFTPKPTGIPGWRDRDLKKRQFVDPTVCGWINHDEDDEVYCRNDHTCMLYTPAGHIGMAGCCAGNDYQNCGWRKTCYGSAQLSTTCTDLSCMTDSFVLHCTDPASPYCVSWTYPADVVQDYGCGTDPASTWATVFKDITASDITTSLSLPYVPDNAVTGWQDSSSTSSSPSSSPTSPSSNSSSSSSSTTHKSVSIGLIVGAAVGGLFVLVCIAGLIAFCCLFKRRKNKSAPSGQPVVQQQQQQQQQQPLMSQPDAANLQMQQQKYYSSLGPSPPYYAPPQEYTAYVPPSGDAKLAPNAQVYPVPSGSPMLSPVANQGSNWGPPMPSGSPQPEIRPVSEAWSIPNAMGQPGAAAPNQPYYPPHPPQQHQQPPASGNPQQQPAPHVFEMGT